MSEPWEDPVAALLADLDDADRTFQADLAELQQHIQVLLDHLDDLQRHWNTSLP